MEGLLFGVYLLQPWKIYLRVAQSLPFGSVDVGKCRLGCWVMQGMVKFVLRDDVVREWSIVLGKFNTLLFTLSSCFSNTYVMEPIVLHGRTEIPYFFSV